VIDLVKQIDKQVSFNVFSRKCGSHIKLDNHRCICDEISEDREKNCNLLNCPLFKGDNKEQNI
jgi:hypothetical protein